MMANARNASLETLYDDQFALLTQLIKPNYLEKYESSMIKLKKKGNSTAAWSCSMLLVDCKERKGTPTRKDSALNLFPNDV